MERFWHFQLTFVNASIAMLDETFSVIFKHRGGWDIVSLLASLFACATTTLSR